MFLTHRYQQLGEAQPVTGPHRLQGPLKVNIFSCWATSITSFPCSLTTGLLFSSTSPPEPTLQQSSVIVIFLVLFLLLNLT